MYYTRFNSPLCEIILVGDENGLIKLHLNTGEGKRKFDISDDWTENYSFFNNIITQINEYFRGNRTNFTVKLNPQGTDYQKKVWGELVKIPYGKVITYKQLAENTGSPKAARAVGNANGKNPIPLIIPCHRVIGSNGKLTGFAHGINIKQKLINSEKLNTLYNKLLNSYGKQYWWPASSDYEMMVGAILTQNTTWGNVEKSIKNFNNQLTPLFISQIDESELAQIIKPSGYFNQKAKKLKALNNWFAKYSFSIDNVKSNSLKDLREELLAIFGVGKETADCILTYALDKPSFVIDTYTKRLLQRIGIEIPKDYDELRIMIERAIPKDLYIYNEFHALIVKHSASYCFKTPKCEGCPIINLCKRKEVI